MGERKEVKMPPKKKDCQVEITSDAQLREIMRDKENFLLETYSEKWGTCKCFQVTLSKLYIQYMDTCKFYRASYEKVKLVAGESYDNGIEPVFHMYEDGKKTKTMVGIDGPAVEEVLRRIATVLRAKNNCLRRTNS